MTSKKETSAAVAENDSVAVNEPHKIKCGLIMPISKSQGLEPEHWLNVKGIICEALADTEFDVRLVSESDDVGVIHKSIVQNIYKNDIVICDVSTHNANVMFELGLRLAFDKPTVIIKDDETPFSFDTQVIEHLVYKRSLHYVDILSFKKKLKDKVLATFKQSQEPGFSTFLGHFTINHVSRIEERTISINDALVDRIDQMQKTINAISRQQNLHSEGSSFVEIYNNRHVAGRGWVIKNNIRRHLSSMAHAGGTDEQGFANQLAAMPREHFDNFVMQFVELIKSDSSKNSTTAPSPSVIRNEILSFISSYDEP